MPDLHVEIEIIEKALAGCGNCRSSGRVWIYVGDGRERKVIGALLQVDWDGGGRKTEDFGSWADFEFRIPLAAALPVSVYRVLGRRKVVRGQVPIEHVGGGRIERLPSELKPVGPRKPATEGGNQPQCGRVGRGSGGARIGQEGSGK
eukprot:scaffold1154_cov200-Cylindrotheca_fusiformis.AAC.2